MSSAIDVSIIIPTRNRWPLLQMTLASALAQEGVTIETIVVDDASSDESSERLARMTDERIRVLRHERRLGPARARNTGIASACGEWMAFLDDDDLWSPRKLRIQLEAAKAAKAGFAYGHVVELDEQRRTVSPHSSPPPPDGLLTALIERNAMPAGASNVVVRAPLLERIGGFDERLSQLADWDMWLRMAEADRGALSGEVVVCYRQHPANLLLADRGDVRHELAYLAAKHARQGVDHHAAFDPVQFSHWVAARQRKAGRRLAAARTHLRAAIDSRDLGHLSCAIRAPLGEWAVGLRQPPAPNLTPPEWLRPYLRW
jgi:glycosyltransferase involved in cell wall biosynthesis